MKLDYKLHLHWALPLLLLSLSGIMSFAIPDESGYLDPEIRIQDHERLPRALNPMKRIMFTTSDDEEGDTTAEPKLEKLSPVADSIIRSKVGTSDETPDVIEAEVTGTIEITSSILNSSQTELNRQDAIFRRLLLEQLLTSTTARPTTKKAGVDVIKEIYILSPPKLEIISETTEHYIEIQLKPSRTDFQNILLPSIQDTFLNSGNPSRHKIHPDSNSADLSLTTRTQSKEVHPLPFSYQPQDSFENWRKDKPIFVANSNFIRKSNYGKPAAIKFKQKNSHSGGGFDKFFSEIENVYKRKNSPVSKNSFKDYKNCSYNSGRSGCIKKYPKHSRKSKSNSYTTNNRLDTTRKFKNKKLIST